MQSINGIHRMLSHAGRRKDMISHVVGIWRRAMS